jgi:regulator of protease activity HflC (stomatin/prohibitin superfamily)
MSYLENRYIIEEVVHSNTYGDIKVKKLQHFKLARDVIAGLVIIAAVHSLWPFAAVPTGNRGVVTTFGKITGIEGEGLATIAPWSKLSVFSIRSEAAQIKDAEGSTSDTQPVQVSMTVRYSIIPNRVAEVFEKYSHNGDLSSYVQTATAEVFKATTAKYTAPDLISKRAEVSSAITTALRTKLEIYGAQVINIDMTEFSFSKTYMAAINEKVTQEQLRLGAENKLKTVEAEQKQKVAVAEAEASATKATADGAAYAQLTVAKAQAESLRIQGTAIQANIGILELRRIEVDMERAKRWNGATPVTMYGSAPIPFVTSK